MSKILPRSYRGKGKFLRSIYGNRFIIDCKLATGGRFEILRSEVVGRLLTEICVALVPRFPALYLLSSVIFTLHAYDATSSGLEEIPEKRFLHRSTCTFFKLEPRVNRLLPPFGMHSIK